MKRLLRIIVLLQALLLFELAFSNHVDESYEDATLDTLCDVVQAVNPFGTEIHSCTSDDSTETGNTK